MNIGVTRGLLALTLLVSVLGTESALAMELPTRPAVSGTLTSPEGTARGVSTPVSLQANLFWERERPAAYTPITRITWFLPRRAFYASDRRRSCRVSVSRLIADPDACPKRSRLGFVHAGLRSASDSFDTFRARLFKGHGSSVLVWRLQAGSMLTMDVIRTRLVPVNRGKWSYKIDLPVPPVFSDADRVGGDSLYFYAGFGQPDKHHGYLTVRECSKKPPYPVLFEIDYRLPDGSRVTRRSRTQVPCLRPRLDDRYWND